MTDKEKVITCLKYGGIALGFILIQTVFGNYIGINGVVPDLFFVFVLNYAFCHNNFKEVVILSISYGIISDFVCYSSFVGCTAMYTYCAAMGYFLKNLFIKPKIIFLSIIALLLFMVGKVILSPVVMANVKITFSDYFTKDIIPSAFYNVICFFVMVMIWKIKQKGRGIDNAA